MHEAHGFPLVHSQEFVVRVCLIDCDSSNDSQFTPVVEIRGPSPVLRGRLIVTDLDHSQMSRGHGNYFANHFGENSSRLYLNHFGEVFRFLF